VRVVNVVPGTEPADFCVRESGTSDWGHAILRNSGTADASTCWNGLPYASATVPFGVGFKKADVKAIPVGGPCSQAATSEADGVSLGPGVTTIVRMGGGSAKVSERIRAFPEDTLNPDSIDLRIRVINAVPGGPDLEIGTATVQGMNISLPATASLILVTRPVAFGTVESAGPTAQGYKVDAQGYMTFDTLGTAFVLVPASQTQAVIAWYQPQNAFTKTMYAIGDPGDLTYPVRGLYCDDASADANNPALDACVLTSLPTIAVDTFNVGLYGANSPNETARKPQIYSALAGTADPPDLGCYAATAEPDANASLVQALSTAGLKYVVNPQPQLTTPATDPTDWSGHTPPVTLANPPCGGTVPGSIFTDAYMCGVTHCNTSPGDPTGVVQGGTSCLTSNCLPQLAAMLVYPWCVNCFAANTGSLQTYATTQQNCTQNTAYPLAAGGANTTLLASRFPFATNTDGSPATDVFYLPSTYERRSILHARVLLNPEDKTNTLDFFCAYLQTPLLLATLPYPGNYANGTQYMDMQGSMNGWRDEQNLQAKRAIAWVQKIAGTGPAIIAGDWHASTHWPTKNSTDGGPLSMPSMAMPWNVGDQSPEVSQQFTGAGFTAAHVSGWTYPCTFCPSANTGPGTPNPYNPPPQTMWVEGYDFNTTYVSGMGFGSVTDEAVTFTGDSVVYDPSKPNQMGPLSEFYGRRVHVIRPQSTH
jgi:hypothetical protein